MNSALQAAECGSHVIVVEKEKELGGWSQKLHAQFPKKQPFVELMPTGTPELEKEVRDHKNINIYTSAEVVKISGQPGIFEISINLAMWLFISKNHYTFCFS